MKELGVISTIYEPLAQSMTQVYFTLERLSSVHILYQFSLQFFLLIVEEVLSQVSKRLPQSSGNHVIYRFFCCQIGVYECYA